MNKYKCPECNSISSEDKWNKHTIVKIQNAQLDTNFHCPSCDWFGNRKHIVQQKEDKTDISSENKYKVGDKVIVFYRGTTEDATIMSEPHYSCGIYCYNVIVKKESLIVPVEMIKRLKHRKTENHDKMQVLSCVEKWKNGDFAVICKDYDEHNKFFGHVGIEDYGYGCDRCHYYVSDEYRWDWIKQCNRATPKIITFKEFEQMQKDDKIGILSCDLNLADWRIIRNFDVKAWKRKEFAVKVNNQDEFDKFLKSVDLHHGNEWSFGNHVNCITYIPLSKRDECNEKWDWDDENYCNREGIKVIDFKDLKFQKDDKKKILSDDLMPNKIIYNTIKNHDDDFASMSFSVNLNPYLSNYRLHEDVRMFDFDNERFERVYLGEWNVNPKGIFQFESQPLELKILKSRNTNFDNIDSLKYIYDASKFSFTQTHGDEKGEEEMTKQTLLDKLTISEIEINKKKKIVLVKDIYSGVASGKLVGNSFDFKSAFALACFNKFKPTLQNVDINESKGTVSLNAIHRGTATVKTTSDDKFNLLVGQALAWLESYLGLSKNKLKKLLSEIEKDVLINQKEAELFNKAKGLKKDIDKKAQAEKEKINKDTKKKLKKFTESFNKDLNDKK